MNKRIIKYLAAIIIALSTVSGGSLFAEEGQVEASYLYNLSNFTGIVPVSWSRIKVDEARDEVYVLDANIIKIFNGSGMEVYAFNEGNELGIIGDIAADTKTGDIIVLSSRNGRTELIRCNFRGDPISTIELKNIPSEFSGIILNHLVVFGDSFYLASTSDMKVFVTDDTGDFKKGYNIAALMTSGLDEKEKEKSHDDMEMTGFSVDRQGNLLLTSASMGKAFRVSRDSGEIQLFGRRGSIAGRFGVPSGILADATGKYIFVADILRCVVLVFDNDFKFYTEFGQRGLRPGNLVGPMYLAVDGKNRLYVSQLRNRGINVYQFSGP